MKYRIYKKILLFFISILFLNWNGFVESNQINDDITSPGELEIIDIDYPSIVLKCFSKFDVDITLFNNNNQRVYFSVFVYLRYDGKLLNYKINCIGKNQNNFIEPFEKKNVSITCITPFNPIRNIPRRYYFREMSEADIILKDADIGIKIIKRFPLNILTRLSTRILPNLMINNWYPIKITDENIYTDEIKIEYFEIPEKTSNTGSFITQINISNHLNIEVQLIIAIDIYSDYPDQSWLTQKFYPIINIKDVEKIFCCKSYNSSIKPRSYKNLSLNCTFPNEGYSRKDYHVMVSTGIFIDIEDTNSYWGKLAYELYKKNWKAIHVPDDYFDENMKRYCYNARIYPYTPIYEFNGFILFDKIYFEGKTPLQKIVEETVNETIEDILIEASPIISNILITILIILCSLFVFCAYIVWINKK